MPADGEGLAGWLLERFRDKDRLLAFFNEHGRFPRTREEEEHVLAATVE